MRNHAVPDDDLAQTEATLAATVGLRGEPSDAERSRTLLAHTATAALSTLGEGGFPFGSLVSHAIDPEGRPLLLLSDLAEHSRNLATDPRASLMATEAMGARTPGAPADPLALARVTLLGRVGELTGAEREQALAVYRAAHPGAFYAGFADFRLYRLDVSSVRYVGGFGRMSWVDADAYTAAEPDPLRAHLGRIVEHMNDDHATSLLAYCRVLQDRPDTVGARMVGVDRYGFDVLARGAGEGSESALRFVFDDAPVDTVEACRAAMVALAGRARSVDG